MKLRLAAMTVALASVMSAGALAASEGGVALDSAPIDSHDFASLQRGAKMFANYCVGCHGLKYLRFTRMAEDLGIPEETVTRNLSFGGKLFAPMISSMDSEAAKAWFSQAEPIDLSLVARSRGTDWLYTYLRSFYRDPERPSGWNNTLFENVSMPHALHSLQGTYAHGENGSMVLLRQGSMAESEYNTAIADIVNFLAYASEPSKNTRHRVGFGVMIFLCFLLVLTYILYREYWRDIKRPAS